MLESEVVVPEGFEVQVRRGVAPLLLGRVEVDEIRFGVIGTHLRSEIKGTI